MEMEAVALKSEFLTYAFRIRVVLYLDFYHTGKTCVPTTSYSRSPGTESRGCGDCNLAAIVH